MTRALGIGLGGTSIEVGVLEVGVLEVGVLEVAVARAIGTAKSGTAAPERGGRPALVDHRMAVSWRAAIA